MAGEKADVLPKTAQKRQITLNPARGGKVPTTGRLNHYLAILARLKRNAAALLFYRVTLRWRFSVEGLLSLRKGGWRYLVSENGCAACPSSIS